MASGSGGGGGGDISSTEHLETESSPKENGPIQEKDTKVTSETIDNTQSPTM